MCSVILSTGWRGFGYCGGLIPELRCGLVSIAWCRGTLMDAVRLQQTKIKALEVAMRAFGLRVSV